jgi:Sec-independent protein translocase protein TatA
MVLFSFGDEMKYLTIILIGVILISVTGCSLISVQSGGGKKAKIPAQPTTPRPLEEALAQEADLARRIAGDIHATGTEAGSRRSGILLDSTDKILTYTGKPSRQITPENDYAIDDLHDRFEKELIKYRNARHQWESDILQLREEHADLAAENGRLKVSFANLKFWFWLVIIALIAIMIIFPSSIPIIWGWAKSAGKALAKLTKRQFSETISAVQKIRKDSRISDEIKSIIDEHLEKAQSADTRIEIDRLKKEKGLK